ncbi:MAG: CDP-alcohol phosphatidyltransferase family protein [Muribaculaceae bacterium]|nr:CDP-alcohol phosphatidyltransferase family protein [Muribaculaceae bacterium]
MNLKKLRESYRSTLKSSDTEETIDLMFYRPIGYVWAIIARSLGIHPNAITIASIFLGIGAGVMFYFDPLWMNIIGMVLLIWANSFDSADGQLARLTGQFSRIGRILDGMAGDLWFIAIYVAICLREPRTSHFFMEHPWAIWVIAAVAGISHVKQAAVADLYRQFHLYFLKGKDDSELETSYELKRQLAKVPHRKFWKRLILIFYIGYTIQQEATTPDMQRFRKTMRHYWPDGYIPQWLRTQFREKSLPLMKYTNILTFNWRSIALFVALFARMPWLYFAFEIVVLNIVMIYMMLKHERICKYFTAELNARAALNELN